MDFVCHFLKLAELSAPVLSCDGVPQFTYLWCKEVFVGASPELLPWPWLAALTSLRPASSLQTCLVVTGLSDDPWSPDLLCLCIKGLRPCQ